MDFIRRTVDTALDTAGSAVSALPIPGAAFTRSASALRQAAPSGAVRKKHLVETEIVDRTRFVWIDRQKADRGVLVYLHGGMFVTGPTSGQWSWIAALAEQADLAVVVVDYRLAPDFPFPVALDEVDIVLDHLSEQGHLTAGRWALVGDDAGAGMALDTALRLRGGDATPAALVLVTPWVDLSLTSPGIADNEKRDPVLSTRMLSVAASGYAAGTPLDDPRLSPLGADLDGLPPTHIEVGTRDLLLNDARVLRMKLGEFGVKVTYRETEGGLHSYAMLRGAGASKDALTEQAEFLRNWVQKA